MLQGNQVPAGNICQLIPWVITAPCLALTPVLNVDSSDIDVLNPLVGASVHGRYATVQNEAPPCCYSLRLQLFPCFVCDLMLLWMVTIT